ncbi:hypothetical protein [Veillonella sp. CHU732]|uniref:hypothetical protein n=1 Tax=Veillonella sp. CHU732 TaxID=2490949 RepID=UPI000F8F0F05|nr:hypothetical protein [Veillonella sp. CHU732]
MVNDERVSIMYEGDGQNKTFAYPYSFTRKEDIVGYVISNGKTKRISTNFEFNPTSKQYMYPKNGTPLARNESLLLTRETPRNNTLQLPNEPIYTALQGQLDKIVRMIQELGSHHKGIPLQVLSEQFDTVIPTQIGNAYLRINRERNAIELVENPFGGVERITSEMTTTKANIDRIKVQIDGIHTESLTMYGEIKEKLSRVDRDTETLKERAKQEIRSTQQTVLQSLEQVESDITRRFKDTATAEVEKAKEWAMKAGVAKTGNWVSKEELKAIQKDMEKDIGRELIAPLQTVIEEEKEKIGGIESSCLSKIDEHNISTTAHNLNKYMSMKPMPTGINDWNNLTDTGMYEATASMWGWRNAPSTARVYYYGVVQVIKSDTNKITQVFYSYGANNKPCNICYRTFYNAWGAWHYHGDYDVTITDITKHNEGLYITKGDVTTVLKLLTTNKSDTNTSLAPTLAVVKELLGSVNIDITEVLKSKGVRYDFSNADAWYLCLGQAFGNLIIQGGNLTSTYENININKKYPFTLPIAFTKKCLFAVGMARTQLKTGWTFASINMDTAQSTLATLIFNIWYTYEWSSVGCQIGIIAIGV